MLVPSCLTHRLWLCATSDPSEAERTTKGPQHSECFQDVEAARLEERALEWLQSGGDRGRARWKPRHSRQYGF